MTIQRFSSLFVSPESLKKNFQKHELVVCLKTLCTKLDDNGIKCNMKSPKYQIIQLFGTLQSKDFPQTDVPVHTANTNSNSKPRRKILSLRKLCSRAISQLPKHSLAVVLAEHTWDRVLSEWNSKGPIPSNIDIVGVERNVEWFSQPGIGPDGNIRFHFTDACHILTCLRTKLCTIGIQGLNRKAWESAALSPNTKLNIAVVIECVDKQDVSLARRIFALDVEEEMKRLNFDNEASFCNMIRLWFDSEDEPGIPATERCRYRFELRRWLLDGYCIGKCPPVTRYVRGIPITTYEALIAHTERKVQMYGFLPAGSYNVRATGSQEVEQFFSTFRDIDPSGKGTPKPESIPGMMSAVAEVDNYRLNPDKAFFMKTSRAEVYPSTPFMSTRDTDECAEYIRDCDTAMHLRCIYPRNHYFDLPERDIRKHKRKPGRISLPGEPAHGERGVRQYHARDDSKILAHRRKGMLNLPDME